MTSTEDVEKLFIGGDHKRGCDGRNYSCSCGYDDAKDEALRSLAAERDRLREALAPFSKFADALIDACPDDVAIGICFGDAVSFGPGAPNVGDLRKARKTLKGD